MAKQQPSPAATASSPDAQRTAAPPTVRCRVKLSCTGSIKLADGIATAGQWIDAPPEWLHPEGNLRALLETEEEVAAAEKVRAAPPPPPKPSQSDALFESLRGQHLTHNQQRIASQRQEAERRAIAAAAEK